MLEGLTLHSSAKKRTFHDGTSVFCREWEGRKDRGIIVYLHGLESHTGWFIDTGNLLNRKGFGVCIVDRRGSGMNQGDRGHMESYWTLVRDVKELIEQIRQEHQARRIYLAASCWGAKIAATFAACHGSLINGLILITPAIKTKVKVSLKDKLDIVFSNFLKPRKLFDIPLEEHTFTKNPKYVEFIKNDELKLRKATARFFFETGKMNLWFNRIASRIHVPVLILLAGQDAVVDNEGIKKWFSRLRAKDKTIEVYPASYHSLHFEEAGNITDYIAKWLEERAK